MGGGCCRRLVLANPLSVVIIVDVTTTRSPVMTRRRQWRRGSVEILRTKRRRRTDSLLAKEKGGRFVPFVIVAAIIRCRRHLSRHPTSSGRSSHDRRRCIGKHGKLHFRNRPWHAVAAMVVNAILVVVDVAETRHASFLRWAIVILASGGHGPVVTPELGLDSAGGGMVIAEMLMRSGPRGW